MKHLICIALVLLIGRWAQGAEENVLQSLRPGHPRLLLLDDELPRLRELIEKDSTARAWFGQLKQYADQLLKEPPAERVLVGPRLLGTSREVVQRVATLAGLYRITGHSRYAQRAKEELLAVARFVDWHPEHFLDTAEMTTAFGIGYDWLYATLSQEERATIRNAIVELGLKPGLKVYESNKGFHTATNNWNQVCNGGLTVGALAVADEEPKIAAAVITKARDSLPRAMAAFAPDGGFIEGPGYWAYAVHYTVLYLAALQTGLGTDFGYLHTPGLAETGNFRMQSVGPLNRTFNFADAHDGVREAPEMFWLARAFDQPVYAVHERMLANERKRVHPFHLFWFNADGTDDDIRKLPTAARFKAIDVALMRTAWNDPVAAFVGFKGGTNGASHSHLDLGNFVYDVDGVRWALDLGPDDYNLLAYFGNKRWDYYRLRTEGHNTLTIDGKNQNASARAPMTDLVQDGKLIVAIVDLSAGYEAPVTSVRRRVELLDRTLMITDFVESTEPIDVVWNLHTEADVKIDPDGVTAWLTQAGKKVRAKIGLPQNAHFEVISASPPPPQKQQPEVKNLIIRQPSKVKDLRLLVSLIPQ